MRKLVGLSAAHPVSAVTLWSIVVVFGVVALTRLPVDLMPTIPLPRVTVVTEYDSLPAEEMEQLVTVPVEDALASVSGMRRIESTTKEGTSSIELAFDWDTDLSVAAVEVREQIDRVYPSLPVGSDKPIAATRYLGQGTLLQVVAIPVEDRRVSFISETVSSQVAARLRQVPGVGRVRLQGQRRREVQVDIDLAKLRAAGLTLTEATRAVGESVYELPAGSYEDGPIERVIKVTTGVQSVEELGRIPLPVPGGALRLSDIAEVRMGEADATSLFLSDGKDALGLAVDAAPGSGALEVSRQVREAIHQLKHVVGGEMELRVVADGAQEIRLALQGLGIAGAIGIVAALVVLRCAFRSLLPATLAIAALPVSAAGSFLVLYVAGLSMNVISLSGIAIGIGMVVDNNVVVLENIRRRGATTPRDVAVATAEMGAATFAGTVTTLLVFLPIVFVPGVVGLLFRDLAASVSLLLAFSLPVSLTLTPALATLSGWDGGRGRLGSIPGGVPLDHGASAAHGRLSQLRRALEVVLNRPFLAIGPYCILVSLAVLLLISLPRELAPGRAGDRVSLELTLSPDTSYTQIREVAGRLDAGLKSTPGVVARFYHAGYEEDAPLERGQPESELRHLRGTLVLDDPTARLPSLDPGGHGTILSEVRLRPPADTLSLALGAGEERALEIRAPTRREAEAQAELIVDQVAGANLESVDQRLAHSFVLLPESRAAAGITPTTILSTLSNAVGGTVAAELRTESKKVDIRVRLRSADTGSIAALQRIAVPGEGGQVELSALGRFEEVRIAQTLRRVDRQPAERVFLPSIDPDTEALFPDNVRILGIDALQETSREIALVFSLALLLMYLLLGAQFESFLAPVAILAMIPVGLAGSLLLLALLRMTINVSSVLGVLVLVGTSVNATILLTDAYRRRPSQIIRATMDRAPAVLITTITTVAALLPLVCLPFPGGELQANTAAAVLGGLVTGTFGTLIIYPALYAVGKSGFPGARG